MKKLTLCLLAASNLFGAGYAYQGTVTFSAATTSSKSNFTEAFSFSDAKFKTTANLGQITSTSTRIGVLVPNDVIFTDDATCATQTGGYAWQYEDYSATAGTGHGWIMLPTLSTGSSRVPVVCVGNSATTTWQGGTGMCAAFDAATISVWHLSTVSSAINAKDFCGSNDGTVTAATVTTGQIDGGAAFNGTANISTAAVASSSANSITASAWLNPQASTPFGSVITKWITGIGDSQFNLLYGLSGNKPQFYANTGFGATINSGVGSTSMTNGTWYSIAGVFDGDVAGEIEVYLDGIFQSSDTVSHPLPSSGTVPYVIGDGSIGGSPVTGSIDEVRIDAAARSADWLLDSYTNQNSPPVISALTPITPPATFVYWDHMLGFGGPPARPGSFPEVYTSVTRRGMDDSNSGVNARESILTQAVVGGGHFGKVGTFSLPDSGEVYGQPLIASQIVVNGAKKNILLVVTTGPQLLPCDNVGSGSTGNSIYAFNADSPGSSPLWGVSYGNTVPKLDVESCPVAMYSNYGIIGTPVLDLSQNAIAFVTQQLVSGTYLHQIHLLDIRTGVTLVPAVTIAPTYSGGLTFDSRMQWQRPGLAIKNGRIYVAFCSIGDIGTWYGWLVSYDESTLAQREVWNAAPGGDGGIWMSGEPPGFDDDGNLILVTGNGECANTGTVNYANSIVKLAPDLTVLDYFQPTMPDDCATLTAADLDLGVAGITRVPGTTLWVTADKLAEVYVVDSTSMGHVGAAYQQWAPGGTFNHATPLSIVNLPIGNFMFVRPSGGNLKAYQFDTGTGMFSTTPTYQSSTGKGGFITLSWDGSDAATAVLWEAGGTSSSTSADVPGILTAFDPTTLGALWQSNDNAGRDAVGTYAKFNPPVVANGFVYLATFDGLINVYGKLP